MQSLNEKNRINDVVDTALKNMSVLSDVNMIMGNAIKGENGEVIIPFSKVTMGVLVGGGEYGKVSIFKKGDDLPYSAGNGSVVSIKPCGFLIKNSTNSDFKVVSVSDSPYEKFIEKASEFLENLKREDNETQN